MNGDDFPGLTDIDADPAMNSSCGIATSAPPPLLDPQDVRPCDSAAQLPLNPRAAGVKGLSRQAADVRIRNALRVLRDGRR